MLGLLDLSLGPQHQSTYALRPRDRAVLAAWPATPEFEPAFVDTSTRDLVNTSTRVHIGPDGIWWRLYPPDPKTLELLGN
jgi:hypothetical protein